MAQDKTSNKEYVEKATGQRVKLDPQDPETQRRLQAQEIEEADTQNR